MNTHIPLTVIVNTQSTYPSQENRAVQRYGSKLVCTCHPWDMDTLYLYLPHDMAHYKYCITRMFCKHQTFANFAMVDQFATLKSAKPKLLLVNTHDPCQNAIVRSQRVKFLQNILVIRYTEYRLTTHHVHIIL